MKIYITSNSSINPVTQSTENILPATIEEKTGERLYCIEPDYKQYITDPGTRRRMSRAVKMGVASAMQCLSRTTQQPDAIITATGLGCLDDTEKFLRTLVQNDEQLLNPTPFIQSTFNTVGAQIAIALKNMNYNMTYVHRGFSFESALMDAIMMLRDKEAQHVLTGTYEETTDTSFEVMKRLGYWRKGLVSGEGSHFFMLSSQPESSTNCLLKDVATVFSSESEIVSSKLSDFLRKNNLKEEDIDLLISGENGSENDQVYYQTIENRLTLSGIVQYKKFFGEYQTASTMACWIAVQLLQNGSIPNYLIKVNPTRPINNILIYNHFNGKDHSFLLLGKDY